MPAGDSDPDRSRPNPRAASLGGLARRIAGWTSRLLVCLIIFVAGLGFGRQVLRWWEADQKPLPTVAGPADDEADRGRDLEFGGSEWSVSQQTIAGDRDAAVADLRATCRRALQSAPLPEAPPTDSEQHFLESLAARKPVEEQAGQWQIYELDRGFPMVAGLRFGEPRQVEGKPVATPPRRAVIWGVAIPRSDRAWVLYTFHAQGDNQDQAKGDRPPLPPGAERMLAIRSARRTVITFSGPDSEPWRAFYRSWFEEQGWIAAVPWRQGGDGWHARWIAPSGTAVVEAQLKRDASDRWIGLVIVSRADRQSAEK